jgi:hypothetical protein
MNAKSCLNMELHKIGSPTNRHFRKQLHKYNNICNYSVQKLLSSSILWKRSNIKVYGTIGLVFFFLSFLAAVSQDKSVVEDFLVSVH